MNERINNNLRAEIGYTDIVNYDDIEIKYNKKLKQFYFLRIEIQFMNVISYDIITGEKIKLSSDWSHFPKHIVLPETTAYTIEELELLYNYLIKHKAEYIEKPIMADLTTEETEVRNAPLTEEEKRKQTEQLFMRLKIMGSNHKRNHKDSTVS